MEVMSIFVDPTYLVLLSIAIYFIISNNIIPKFPGRRRAASGLVGAFLLQAFLLSFHETLGVTPPTANQFKLVLIAAIVGSVISELVHRRIR